jgi:hypothetical protein
MRQGKLFTFGILFAMCAVMALIGGQIAAACIFAVLASPFSGLWFYRYQRDKNIIAQARRERQQAIQIPSITPPMESKGSRRLFVPPPLD